jgi:hypothetical protein
MLLAASHVAASFLRQLVNGHSPTPDAGGVLTRKYRICDISGWSCKRPP